jgi:hypothetical protein
MRKLRMYKGVTYNCGFWYDRDGDRFSTAASLIVNNRDSFSDDDHAPLMDLKKTPYEPVLTLGQVVYAWWERSDKGPFIRAADIEDLCSRLRNAFPNIDGEDA